MTKKEINEMFGDNAQEVIDMVRDEVKRFRTNWSAISFVNNEHIAGFTRCGFRKNTTGEYVPNAYRNNFGWKNTYYQHAELRIFVPRHLYVD